MVYTGKTAGVERSNKQEEPVAAPPAEQKSGYKDRPWIPRFWDGMCLGGWLRLLARNRFRVAPRRIAMALLIVGIGAFNFFLWLLQTAIYGRRIDRAKIEKDPIFVIGHWRSGTTMLHELLVLDSRHTFADTYACFAPNHFLVSSWWVKPLLQILLPSRRPMDNMAAGWDRPQEDEFALCNMGVPSPYLTITFPNHPPQDQEYLDMRGRVGPRRRTMETLTPLVPPLHHAAESQADRAEIAAAHLPDRHAPGDVPQGEVRPHRPRSLRAVALDNESLASALSRPGPSGAEL